MTEQNEWFTVDRAGLAEQFARVLQGVRHCREPISGSFSVKTQKSEDEALT